MLTLFTTPKPFRGHIKTIQTNAIQSWTLLHPQCEIILFGDEEGTAEIASHFKIHHISRVECNEYGTPLISSMFKIAQETAHHPLIGYVNADIILLSDFVPALQRVLWPAFLVVGQRWDIDIKEPVDFSRADWEKQLRTQLLEAGKLHPPTGIDYFVFPRGQFRDIPPLVVGRAGWDNWIIYHTRRMKIPVIDATKVITAVHQNHDYSHHPAGKAGVWGGAEARQNRTLAGGHRHVFNIHDSDWVLSSRGIRRACPMKSLYQSGLRLVESIIRALKRTPPPG